MEMGEHWAYRTRPKELGSPVRQVEIVRVGGQVRTGSLHVRFLDGDDAGLQEWVNAPSLVARWEDVEAFRSDDARVLALADASRHMRGSPELEAARMIFDFVRSKLALTLFSGPGMLASSGPSRRVAQAH